MRYGCDITLAFNMQTQETKEKVRAGGGFQGHDLPTRLYEYKAVSMRTTTEISFT